MKSLLSTVFLLALMVNPNQSPINYQPKSLDRVMEKLWGENLNKTEIILSDSIIETLRIKGKFFSIADEKNNKSNKYVYVGRINSCRAGGCSISINSTEEGEFEYFDYFILFDHAAKVELVKVYNYQATHGQEVTAKGWLKQFSGYSGEKKLNVGKNIDAIAGATISVYAITADVKHKTAILKKLLLQEITKS